MSSRLVISSDDLKLRHPFNMIIGGASGSGKTEWLAKFLLHRKSLITPAFSDVLYCYGVYDNKVLEFERQGFSTHLGTPSEEHIRQLPKPLLLVLDDLMMNAKSKFLDILFTRGSHHWNTSVVFITQNLFEPSIKTARNNAHYLVLLRNPSGRRQIRDLGCQLFPGTGHKYFNEAYSDATSANFGYLFVDIHPSSSELVRLRTGIFPGDRHTLFLPS